MLLKQTPCDVQDRTTHTPKEYESLVRELRCHMLHGAKIIIKESLIDQFASIRARKAEL